MARTNQELNDATESARVRPPPPPPCTHIYIYIIIICMYLRRQKEKEALERALNEQMRQYESTVAAVTESITQLLQGVSVHAWCASV